MAFQTVDDFEEASPLDDYNGDTGSFSVTTDTSRIQEGSQGIVSDSSGTIWGNNSDYDFADGDTSSIYTWQFGGTFAGIALVVSGSSTGESDWDGYHARIDLGFSVEVALQRYDNGSSTTLAQQDVTQSNWQEQVNRITLELDSSGNLTAEFYQDGSTTPDETLTATDTNHSPDRLGLKASESNDYFDLLELEPGPINATASVETIDIVGPNATLSAPTTPSATVGVIDPAEPQGTVSANTTLTGTVDVVNTVEPTATLDNTFTGASTVQVIDVVGPEGTVSAPTTKTGTVGVVDIVEPQGDLLGPIGVGSVGEVTVQQPQGSVTAPTTRTAGVETIAIQTPTGVLDATSQPTGTVKIIDVVEPDGTSKVDAQPPIAADILVVRHRLRGMTEVDHRP